MPRLALHHRLMLFVAGVIVFVLLMTWAEARGLPPEWIGPIFLFAPVMVYAAIGVFSRSAEPEDFYVAGRRVPAFYNGMAATADSISVAAFLSLAGTLYLQGFSGSATQPGGLAYLMGWIGGFCLLGLLIAPRLRALRLYTVPDFFALRFGGRWPRRLAALGALLVSFLYVVAQIYGVGLIASRLTGVQVEIGILLGLGGVLLCSFLGGMRAITWTQVAQCVVLTLAFVTPVSWLAYKQLGTPLALLVYGGQLPHIARMEQQLIDSPAEQQARAVFAERAAALERRLAAPQEALEAERARRAAHLRELQDEGANFALQMQASRELAALPENAAAARARWTRELRDARAHAAPLAGLPRHGQAFAGSPNGSPEERAEFHASRRNFLALMFCLMLGTASFPHLLTRFYTTAGVAATRRSVMWSMVLIVALFMCAPALATLVKFEIMGTLVGTPFDALPHWVAQWEHTDPTLISVRDANGDGVLQFAELHLAADMITLLAADLGGLPFAISSMVAAGGMAAALSTADSLLLTISNALVHDHSAPLDKRIAARLGISSPAEAPSDAERAAGRALRLRRVIQSKIALLLVAALAASVAIFKPEEGILVLITAAFSLAASIFFPALVLGLFWRGATARGAVAGMVGGTLVTTTYMLHAWPALLDAPSSALLFDVQPIAAGVFGVPVGFALTLLVSLWEQRTKNTKGINTSPA